MFVALSAPSEGRVEVATLDADAVEITRETIDRGRLPELVRELEGDRPRWVWADTARWYPSLLAAGTRIERCVDLRMVRLLLRNSVSTRDTRLASVPRDRWDVPASSTGASDALFELEAPAPDDDPVEELRMQRAVIAESASPGRLSLLAAADSLGALVAVEMRFAGLPWDRDRHEGILTELLGPRAPGARPRRMEELVGSIREALDDPEVNPDSPPVLLRSLQRAGLQVASTSRWELRGIEHPVIEPLLAYKKLARLYSANGWAWLDEWVADGRFRPVYLPSSVVTGRWASEGGGALQLPKQIRGAAVADPGWKLVVADAAQLEPRVLAAMSGDAAMARAGQAHDMYEGMVSAGAVETRSQAKYGMLGAIYGGTAGESGRMRPRIERAFPRAMAFVEDAARAGERGEVVSTWLGRSSPPGHAAGYDETRSPEDRDRSRSGQRAWGRFTRNFVVQGTAAEWALCWMGGLRRVLWELGEEGALLIERPHLVFFLHDELIVHTPERFAEEVAEALRASAAEAGRIMFGSAPVEFPLTVAIVDTYADAD
ncbi:bifunctional 3'-5' exonuclease/DNA polymerase [Homoserinibacter sp. GY 40078]|uniref:bifunctional 3'-5' exonuclease/DNA polymerase n=1 Tax=Homoserinibacter sp. GY 40078 TaxID=2603275 RepID=UPI0011CC0301|nr:bifunctional 3'-5' exonuclease/DNA polymerase [Homoserinibacter sp. GY 40078]TXK17434.1 bifunctional 3'-5' exonuclease/DNA polymerase [Homoserinibacter sp. GY 40078]